ncbi:hypothetical protein HY612_05795 [Candidatus Roizmanbacteria bacterium]|nr:hypothetical protein [Candidatus Roizmanbacteria bacterium]
MKTSDLPKDIIIDNPPKDSLLHELEGSEKKIISKKSIVWSLVIIFFGIFSGFVLSNLTRPSTSGGTGTQIGGTAKSKTIVGSTDAKVFRDSAEGDLEVGGINGEGTHKLTRPGGESQTVYLTSSVLDLNQFLGKKVRVWGETFAAQQAGWFMDVGKVEVL